jgi:hypothetical protein
MNRMLHDQLEDDNYEANLTDGNNGQNDGWIVASTKTMHCDEAS